MKDKQLIYQGDPCTMCLDAPEVQALEDAGSGAARYCRYYDFLGGCSASGCGCVQVAGLKVARYVLLFYSEASEKTLALELARFEEQAPLPPERLEAYIDTPGYEYRRLTDGQRVVQRVSDFARAVLALKPGERIFRSPEEPLPPPMALSVETSE